jgi:3-deoxy-D-manno-octulosonate 8-phosphate phosphatase (KDO 8-P phosphatase)
MTDLKTKLTEIKLVVLDVDGVLTDDTVFVGPDGMEFKRFCIADGLGIVLARKFGINIALLSGRPSPATTIRAQELGIEDVFMKPVDKLGFYDQLKLKYDLGDNNIAYMGNDLVDISVMKQCGLAVAVPDSPESVRKAAAYTTVKHGGFGAVREFLDMILDAKNIREEDRLA